MFLPGLRLASLVLSGYLFVGTAGCSPSQNTGRPAPAAAEPDRPDTPAPKAVLTAEEPWYQGQPLAHWITALKDKSFQVRENAARVLGQVIVDRDRAVGPLAAAMKDPHHHVRQAAAGTLGSFSQDGVAAVPALTESLKDESGDVRVMAAGALLKITPGSSEAAQVLISELRTPLSPRAYLAAEILERAGSAAAGTVPALAEILKGARNVNEAASAIRVLGAIGEPAVPSLIGGLRHADAGVPQACARALKGIGPNARGAVPVLVQALKEKDPQLRLLAAEALGQIGPDAAPAVPELTELLKDADPGLRQAAAASLGSLGTAAESAVAGLIDLLRQGAKARSASARPFVPGKPPPRTDPKELDTAMVAARALGRIGGTAVPALAKALPEPDREIREHAALALARIGPPAKAAVPALIKVLQDEKADDGVRGAAARALAAIGPDAGEAVPALVAALKQPRQALVEPVFHALAEIGKSAVPALVGLLQDKNPYLRQQAARALGEIGREALPAVPALTTALKDQDRALSAQAAEALGRIGPGAAEVVPELAALLETRTGFPPYRRAIARAVGEMGAQAKGVVPALLAALRDPDEEVAATAAQALHRFGSAVKVADWIDALKNASSREVRTLAARALAERGSEAKEAVPVLRERLERQEDSFVKTSLAVALGRLDPPSLEMIRPLLLEQVRRNDPHLRQAAVWALVSLGVEKKVTLAELLQHRPYDARTVEGLRRLGTDAKLALPVLREALWSSHQAFADSHSFVEAALLCIRLSPQEMETTVSALGERLAQAWREEKQFSQLPFDAVLLSGLAELGPRAKSVVPVVLPLLNAPRRALRQAAADALKKIDPEAAAKAGIR